MNRAEFEADLRRDGYEVSEGEIAPNVQRSPHAHDFDTRVMVLQGSITLVFGEDRRCFAAGDTCSVPAGTMHAEQTGAEGVHYLAGRRPATRASSAA
jgi:uncharacterized cupin superfamily protein